MSRVTYPETESSVSCGFYNSDGAAGSRKYYASEMSRIFDGIIKDGIFASIGTCFAVNAYSENTVNVGIGKCWFNHTWTENDATLPVNCGEAEQIADANRIDAIVIEVDSSDSVRDNFIKVVKGTVSTKPVRPTMIHTSTLNQYALCYIYRAAGSKEITQADITNVIGTDETPFITGVLETISLDELLGQWQDDLNRFVASEKARATTEIDNYIETNEEDFAAWYAQMKQLMEDAVGELNVWTENQKRTILDWFEHLVNELDENQAVNLQLQIDEVEVKNILLSGLPDGQKTLSPDNTVITSVDSDGRKLVKTFTNNFLTCTTVLTDSNNTEIGRHVKEFSSDGRSVNSTVTVFPSTIIN